MMTRTETFGGYEVTLTAPGTPANGGWATEVPVGETVTVDVDVCCTAAGCDPIGNVSVTVAGELVAHVTEFSGCETFTHTFTTGRGRNQVEVVLDDSVGFSGDTLHMTHRIYSPSRGAVEGEGLEDLKRGGALIVGGAVAYGAYRRLSGGGR